MGPRLSFIVACLAAISLLSACNLPSAGLQVGVTPTQASAAPSEVPEAAAPEVEITTEAQCYSGPGVIYDPVGVLAAGIHHQVVAIDDEPTWFQIDPTAIIDPDPPGGQVNGLSPQPDPPGSATIPRCWVPGDSVDLSGDLGAVPVVEMPVVRLLESTDCRQGTSADDDVEWPLEAGASFLVIGVGDQVVRIDDEPTWSQIDDEPTWLRIDDEPTWLRIDDEPTWLRIDDEPTWLRIDDEPTWLRIDDEPTWLQIDPTAILGPDSPSRPPDESAMRPRCWIPGEGVELSGDTSQLPVTMIPAALISADVLRGRPHTGRVEVEAVCSNLWEDLAEVRVSRTPASADNPTVSADGEAFGLCHAVTSGVYQCVPLGGDVGSVRTIRTCYPGEACQSWTVTVPACPEPRVSEVEAVCTDLWEGIAAVQIHGGEATLDEVRVAVDSEPFALCHAPARGVKECLPLPGELGSTHIVRTCYPGEACEAWRVHVPECLPTPQVVVTPVCDHGYAAVRVAYTPVTLDPPWVTTGGRAFGVCHMPERGAVQCFQLPGEVGSPAPVQTCFRGEPTCASWRVTVPGCAEMVVSEGLFALAGVGCHDTRRIFFTLDTGLSSLAPGEASTLTASDGLTTYSCSLHPSIAGRLYCYGNQPGSPQTLEVCVRQDGQSSPTCRTFPDWPATESAIPSCAPTPISPAVDPCSQWTQYGQNGPCSNMGCVWDPGGFCRSP